MRYLRPIINITLPTIVFYIAYKLLGILPAVVLSLIINMMILIYDYVKRKPITNTQIIGILGGVFSVLAIWGGGSEKWTFVPALIQNIVMTVLFVVLTVKKQNILKFLLEDFQVKILEGMKDEKLMMINIIWIMFFILKILVKLIGIVMLDYERLYWLVFMMGDPAFIIVVILTVIILRNSNREKQTYDR